MKRLLVIFSIVFATCAMLMFMPPMPQNAIADSPFVIENGVITGYSGDPPSSGDLVIPSSIDGVAVTGIGGMAFAGCSGLNSINIPSGVTSIGAGAFYYSSLESLYFYGPAPTLESGAFEGVLDSFTVYCTAANQSSFSGWTSYSPLLFKANQITSFVIGSYTGVIDENSHAISVGVPVGTAVTNLTPTITVSGYATVSPASGAAQDFTSPVIYTVTPASGTTQDYTVTIVFQSIGVTYNGNGSTGGSVPVDTNTYVYNASATVLGCGTMVKEGYTFAGWNTAANGSGTSYAQGSSLPLGTSNVTLYAKWNYNVSGGQLLFDASSGTITGFNGSPEGDLVIPGSINNVTVTGIADSAFFNCQRLVSISIPSSITSIGDYGFGSCYNLTSVNISSGVRNMSIGDFAFAGTNLKSIIIPAGVTSIGQNIFDSDFRLTEINVDSGNAKYASVSGILFNQTKKELIKYPQGKTGAAYSMPSSVTSIDQYAFYGCNLTSVDIANGVQSIGKHAFEACGDLTTVTIPASVTIISDKAFWACSYLSAAYFHGDKPTTLGDNIFDYAAKGFTVYIPPGNTTYKDWNVYSIKDYLIYKGAQKKSDGGNYDVRFIATIDTLDPDSAGFVYSSSNETPTIGGGTQQVETKTVYTSILANNTTKLSKDLGGTYIIACPVMGVPNDATYYVRAYAIQGTETIYTDAVTVKVSDLSLPK